ncbi:MAG: phosphodiesterase [Victivallales bacterium]|nr:phosphodiesterase [Victivallales bacterium]
MARLMILSDIHGCPKPLETFFQRAEEYSPEAILLLGDALYHGPRNGVPKDYDTQRTVELLNAHADKIIAVCGNCDSEVDQMLLHVPLMADYAQVFADGKRIFLTHGHHYCFEDLPPLPAGSVFLQGHTHIPVIRHCYGDITGFNPGSIALPKQGNPPTYGVWDNGRLSLRLLDTGELFEA